MLASLRVEDANAAMQNLYAPERMAVLHIMPDGSADMDAEDEE